MNINNITNEDSLTLQIQGRIDTKTAPELEDMLKSSLGGIKQLTIDLADVDYISSAGLRVLLIAQKTMNRQGNMTVRNVSQDIMDIFDVTGFSDILTIQ